MDETSKYITRAEHKEFAERLDAENDRQNHRIERLEESVREISRLTTSVEKMAVSLETMAKEQEKQGERLAVIEQKPAKNWETVVTGILAAIVGALGAALASGLLH